MPSLHRLLPVAVALTAVVPAIADAKPRSPNPLCPMKAKTCAEMPWDRYEIAGVYVDGTTTAVEHTDSHEFTMKGETRYAMAPRRRGRFENVTKNLATVKAPVEVEITSQATWTGLLGTFDCSWNPPRSAMPPALAATFVRRGANVSVQWSFAPAGWACAKGPDTPMSPSSPSAPADVSTTVHPVTQFKGRKVKLKIDRTTTWGDYQMQVTQTWWGDITLVRVR
jgi:hypothetical protein